MAYLIGGLIGFNLAMAIVLVFHMMSGVRRTLSTFLALPAMLAMAGIWTATATGHINAVADGLHINHFFLWGGQVVALYLKGHHLYRMVWPK